jgi:hypothetical protein
VIEVSGEDTSFPSQKYVSIVKNILMAVQPVADLSEKNILTSRAIKALKEHMKGTNVKVRIRK